MNKGDVLMKIRKIIFVLTFLILTVTFLTSCTKLTNEEYIDVEAVITDTYYKPPYTTYVMCGKVPVVNTYPAEYRITVKYEGVEYNISGSKFYKENKDKIGKTVKVVCHKRYYEDGSVKKDIESPGKTDDNE
jgi:hypothetical protein